MRGQTETRKPYRPATVLQASSGSSRRGAGYRNGDVQAIRGQSLDQSLAPLHHRDRTADISVQVQIVHFSRAGQPVGVRVHQRRAAAERPVDPGNDESRRGHRAADVQPLADPLDERGLPGAERSTEHHQVTGAQQGCQPLAQRAHVIGGRHPDARGQHADRRRASHRTRR
jgi:hypothetical protein